MIDIITNDYRQVDIPKTYSFVEWDMGCGRGKYTIELSKRYPDRLIIASDVMIGRLHRIEKKVDKQHLDNVLLVRAESAQAVRFQIPYQSIDRLHLLCPDPWPKDKGKARRLICTAFLSWLPRIIKPGGILHMSTDHPPYWEDWSRMLANLPFLEKCDDGIADVADIKTDFELQWLAEGKEVRHLTYRLV